MPSNRQLHLGAFMRPVSIHTGAWRYPGAWRDANFNFERLKTLAQALERACFDAFFVADHLGLVATASTTFDEPFHIARRFASLDHLSGGRAGWNIVTTSNPDAALNFDPDRLHTLDHKGQYLSVRGPLHIARQPLLS